MIACPAHHAGRHQAAAALCAAGMHDKFDCFQHATKLSAGPEALLGYAEGMLHRGFPGSGSVYAAAWRTVEAQPCNAAAHAALGLACEARGAWSDAAHALGTAVELAQEGLTNGEQGSEVIACKGSPTSHLR